jgi:tRNA G46 methylase TrmB
MKFTQDELKRIEQQLSNPEGEFGVEIAKNMNESNIKMTINSIKSLNLLESDILLEIGHGNCGHLKKIYNATNDIQYFGLEISETMKYEAERINQNLIQNNRINFSLYDGIKIPF